MEYKKVADSNAQHTHMYLKTGVKVRTCKSFIISEKKSTLLKS